jgi:hypothetical protein
MPEAKDIHQAIANVMAKVGYVQKTGRITVGQVYTYASESDLIAAIRPELIEQGITVSVADVTELRRETYRTAKGQEMNVTIAHLVVRFTHAPSGTHIDVHALGEGADSGDKATPKALTGAYKYALRQTFCIETGDDPDQQPSATIARGDGDAAKADQNAWLVEAQRVVRGAGKTFKEVLGIDQKAGPNEVRAAVLAWADRLPPGTNPVEELKRIIAGGSGGEWK